MSAQSKDVFGDRFLEVCVTVVRGLDTVQDMTDEGETQHRSELVDKLCLTFCHMLTLADIADIHELNRAMLEHTMEPLREALMVTINRVSPSHGAVMLHAIQKLKKVSERGTRPRPAAKAKRQSEDEEDEEESIFKIFRHMEKHSCIGIMSPL